MINYLVLIVFSLLGSTLVIIVGKMFDKNPAPLFGAYQNRSGVYWIKVIFMYALLLLKKMGQKLTRKNEEFYEKLDNVQKLPSTPKAVDAVYFNAANKNGDHLIVGTARRPNRLIDGFFYLKLQSSKFGLLESPKIPDTSLFNSAAEESYEADGIQIALVEPMKKWRISFKGNLKEANNRQQLHKVSIDAQFTSDEPCFNYETQMDDWTMAKCLAYENWSRSYFKNMKMAHQLHYEQFGILKAKITVDDEAYEIEFDAVRDHTIGKHRDWASFRRYALHWVTTENGDHFSVGSVCQPINFSRMQIGYMYNALERKMYPVTNSTFHLYQWGEMGSPPKDYAFTFNAGKTDYAMQVNISEAPYFYISKNWESKVYECLCTVRINGIKGYGGVEWDYRNVEGRNVEE
ncbi:unnamed protein product [Ceutorhynchus assimilis]|uniref:Uncharacterized protein n=1 Tax=Ceutorhynchus assimilis TaxID=467358 RepID=A0A9N9QDB8_9CUCU|nr:unnamed protein product [Ceutorhynchus assimilis]